MRIGKASAYLLTAIFFAGPLYAAEPTITAKVNTTELTMDSSLTLSVEISGLSNVNSAPDLTIPNFSVQRAGQTQSYQWVNGESSSFLTFQYVLTPTKSGALQIPSITLQNDGKSYTTQPITINVSNGAGGAAVPATSGTSSSNVAVPNEGMKPVFMTARVDKNKAYVGEQVLLTVQFLRRPNVGLTAQPRYAEPDMTGFVVEPAKQQEMTTNINGVPYIMSELKYYLFPTSDGEFTIGGAAIDLVIRTPGDPFDANSFFQNFFNQGQSVKLNTRAIPITVRPLPKNKPTAFTGAVGRYKISAKADTAQPEVGKPFNLIVKIEGVGNIKSIREPEIPDLRGFRRYETISKSESSNEGKFFNGSKEFKILLIPQVSGTLSIPPISYTYFNPEDQQYATATSPAISFQVKAGNLSNASQEFHQPMPSSDEASEGIRVMEKDIRFIKNGTLKPAMKPLHLRGIFWMTLAFPPLFALVAFLYGLQTRRRSENVAHYRAKEAHKNASKALKDARKLLGDPDASKFYGALYDALVGFLADKFSISPSGIIWNDLERRLAEKSVEASLIASVRDLFDQADMARFGTSSFTDEEKKDSLKKTGEVLSELGEML